MLEGTMLVTIHRYESGELKGFADVTVDTSLGEVTLCGFRIMQKQGKGPWIGYPSSAYQKDNQTRYKKFIDAPQATQRRITQAILAEFQK